MKLYATGHDVPDPNKPKEEPVQRTIPPGTVEPTVFDPKKVK